MIRLAKRLARHAFAEAAFRRLQLSGRVVMANKGYCPCCRQRTRFVATDAWLRDHFLCQSCDSIPRERALMWTIDHFRPAWASDRIHESSPVWRGASERLRQAPQYIPSQFFDGVPSGQTRNGIRCENLEALSFADASVDLHVTQDVMEHVFEPDAVWREIARTLAPGGMHIFTTPLVEKDRPSQCAASLEKGRVVHHREPEYHGNPMSAEGSLVTMRWGYDITECIARASGLHTKIVYIDALELGIRAEYIEVLVTHKPMMDSAISS